VYSLNRRQGGSQCSSEHCRERHLASPQPSQHVEYAVPANSYTKPVAYRTVSLQVMITCTNSKVERKDILQHVLQEEHFMECDMKQYWQEFVSWVAQSVYKLTTGWTVQDQIPVGTRFSARPGRPWAHPASCTMGTGSFPGVKCGQSVLLTTHPLPVSWSWKNRAIPLPNCKHFTTLDTGTWKPHARKLEWVHK